MSDTSIQQMRIFELRNKLKDVGLSGSGTKAELIARLTQYYEENEKKEEIVETETPLAPPVENVPTEQPTTVVEESAPELPVPENPIEEPTAPILESNGVPQEKESVNTSTLADLPVESATVTPQSILEARCKRFGIPYNPSNKAVEVKQKPLQSEYRHKLEERRKRFGVVDKQMERSEKKPRFSTLSEEEKQKLQARRKRFGLN